MKKIITILILLATYHLQAQINLLGNFDPHSKLSGSELFPSRLGAPGISNEITAFSIYAGASNNAVSYKDVNDIINQLNKDSTLDVSNLKNKFKDHNMAFAKIDMPIIEGLFTIMKKKKHPLTIQLGSRLIMEANVNIPKNIGSFIADGNGQWAGQNISLGPIQFNAITMAQHYIGVSMPFNVSVLGKTFKLFPAVRLKYIAGFENIYSQKSDLNLYTQTDGRYLQANYNYNINVAADSLKGGYSDITKARGHGYGIDLGLGVQYGDRWTVDISITDIGAINFTKDVANYSKSGTYTYDGLVTQFDYFGHYTNSVAPNKSNIIPDTTHNGYSTPLGAKLALMVNYHVGKLLNKSNVFKWYRHNFYFMYVQGFQTIYNTVNRPNATLGYTFSLKKILSIGVNASTGGYYPTAAGAMLSLKFGIHTITIGSNNLTYFISPSATYGGDVYLRFGFAF